MSCWSKKELEQMLEDVVNELDLSEISIEKHGPLATPPAELVRLVLKEKDSQIHILKKMRCDYNKKELDSEETHYEKNKDNAYVEYGIKERFPIHDEWDDIDKIYAKGQRDGARWMVTFLSEIMSSKDAEIAQLKENKKDIAYMAWKDAANAYRLYPNNKHTFSDYWETLK